MILFFLYIDAGTGALIINMIIALFVSIAYYFRTLFFWLFNIKVQKNKNMANKLSLFSEGEQYWDTFKPIIDSLIKKKVFFNYFTMSIKDPALLIENKFIHSKYIGRNFLGYHKFSKINSKFLIATTPNIGNKDFALKKPKNVSNMIHVYHSIIGLPHYKIGALDNYDSVIIGGNYQIKPIRDIEKLRNLKIKKLYKLGIPYLDTLYKKKGELNSRKKTILIASSWGLKGCFKAYGTDFIEKLSCKDYDIILRPHPQSYISELNFIENIKKRFENKKNVFWDDSASPSKSMNKSNILISDSSSIRFDFSFIYKRPVITLKIKRTDMNGFENQHIDSKWEDKAEKIIGAVVYKDGMDSLDDIVEKYFLDFDSNKIKTFRNDTFYKFGESGKSISNLFKQEI